jgi:hypothetical protein
VLLLSALACLVAACAAPAKRPVLVMPAAHPDGDGRPVEIRPPVDLARNEETAVVRLAGTVTCSGTLIAEDLVLTAHHCVAQRDAAGRLTGQDKSPDEIVVELGTTYLPWGEVGVRAIVSPDCGYASGDGDIAILVLKRKLIGVASKRPEQLHAMRKLAGVVSASVMDGDAATSGFTVFTRIDAWRHLLSAAREIADGATASELPPFRSCDQRSTPEPKAKAKRAATEP